LSIVSGIVVKSIATLGEVCSSTVGSSGASENDRFKFIVLIGFIAGVQ
jgi:hypothetical protein